MIDGPGKYVTHGGHCVNVVEEDKVFSPFGEVWKGFIETIYGEVGLYWYANGNIHDTHKGVSASEYRIVAKYQPECPHEFVVLWSAKGFCKHCNADAVHNLDGWEIKK